MNTSPELLLPAGNMEKLRAALLYGANAVYLGGNNFNLRAKNSGFEAEELKTAVLEARAAKAKIYYCLNSFPQESSLALLPGQIEEAAACGVDAFIVADPGVLRLTGLYAPKTPVHLSTQANSTNSEAVKFWLDQGVSRVNLARELDREEIKELRRAAPEAELEVFVQGAMCLAVSGQCLLSAWLNRRPANLGRCTQPCRFEYRALPPAKNAGEYTPDFLRVEERTRPGEEVWSVHAGNDYSSFWAPDDLCLMPWLPWFGQNGINALKVEGRTKSAAYAAHMADAYATALKAIALEGAENFDCAPYLRELVLASSRPLGSGFFLPGDRINLKMKPGVQTNERPVIARVLEQIAPGRWAIEVKDNWAAQDAAELMLPGLLRPRLEPGWYGLCNHREEAGEHVSCGTKATLVCDHPDLRTGIFIRKITGAA